MKIRKLNVRDFVVAVLEAVNYSNKRLGCSHPAVKRISASFNQRVIKNGETEEDFSKLSKDYVIHVIKKNNRLVVELNIKNIGEKLWQ